MLGIPVQKVYVVLNKLGPNTDPGGTPVWNVFTG